MHYKKFPGGATGGHFIVYKIPKPGGNMYYDYVEFYIYDFSNNNFDEGEIKNIINLGGKEDGSPKIYLDQDPFNVRLNEYTVKITIGEYNFIEIQGDQNILEYLCGMIKNCKEIYESLPFSRRYQIMDWILPS